MIHLTDEMRELVNGARASGNPCIVATASPDGTPNRDSGQEVGWKFRCTATVHRDGPIYDEVMGRLAESGMPPPDIEVAIVVLRIDQVLTLFGEVLQERVPNLTW